MGPYRKFRFIGLLVIATFLAWNPIGVEAHHRPGHNQGGGEPSPGVAIDLLNCGDGAIAKWKGNAVVTFQIVNVSGVGEDVIQAVRDGVLRWNAVPSPYSLVETNDPPDIIISVYFKIIPGFVLGFAAVHCPNGASGIQTVDISLGVKGLSLTGVRNLTAHEVGHGLGLGHTDSLAEEKGDLMGARFEQREEGKKDVCPSNLDTGGLRATEDPYTIPAAEWQQHLC